MRSDKDLLDFLDAWGNIDIGSDPDDDVRTVHRVTGPINDREWEEIGRGPSLRAALDRAMTFRADEEAAFNRSLLKTVT